MPAEFPKELELDEKCTSLIVKIKPVDEDFELIIDDLTSAVTNRLNDTDRSIRQFYELLLSQSAFFRPLVTFIIVTKCSWKLSCFAVMYSYHMAAVNLICSIIDRQDSTIAMFRNCPKANMSQSDRTRVFEQLKDRKDKVMPICRLQSIVSYRINTITNKQFVFSEKECISCSRTSQSKDCKHLWH